MKSHAKIGILAILLLIATWAVAEKPDFVEVENPAGRLVAIPEHAVEVAPGVFSLGSAVHEGKLVEGYAIVHYKEGHAKPTGCNDDGKCQGFEGPSCGDCSNAPAEDSSCYSLYSRGVKWKTAEPYIVNPTNTVGLDNNFVISNFATNIEKWEAAAATNIFGDGSVTNNPLSADTTTPDGQNEVYFGTIDESNAIAITIVWGVFKGAPSQRMLIEWDHIYDQVDFEWSSEGDLTKMDFESIATHELGHSAGLEDLYTLSCSQETMYGYASEGETNKRTLESGDITGMQVLYQ